MVAVLFVWGGPFTVEDHASAAGEEVVTCAGEPATIIAWGSDISDAPAVHYSGTSGRDVVVLRWNHDVDRSNLSFGHANQGWSVNTRGGDDLVCIGADNDRGDVVPVNNINLVTGGGADTLIADFEPIGVGTWISLGSGADKAYMQAPNLSVFANGATAHEGFIEGDGGIDLLSLGTSVCGINLDADLVPYDGQDKLPPDTGGFEARTGAGCSRSEPGAIESQPEFATALNTSQNVAASGGPYIVFRPPTGSNGREIGIGPGNGMVYFDEFENFEGSTRSDLMIGDDGDNEIWAHGGRDEVRGASGEDTIWGGTGNDELHGGSGADTIDGGPGADVISGKSGNDAIDGGDGADTISGNDGNDTINGGDGADTISGNDGNDIISGGVGNDYLAGGKADDEIAGDGGSDEIYGRSGNDILNGGSGADKIYPGVGSDAVDGASGTDSLHFDEPVYVDLEDALFRVLAPGGLFSSATSIEKIFGSGQNDLINGVSGGTTIYAGAGIDKCGNFQQLPLDADSCETVNQAPTPSEIQYPSGSVGCGFSLSVSQVGHDNVPYSYLPSQGWSVAVKPPGASVTFGSSSSTSTAVSVSKNGDYTFKFVADDGWLVGSRTAQVLVAFCGAGGGQ